MITILYMILLSAGFCWLIKRILKNRSVILSTNELIMVFGVKVLAGAAYGYIFLHFFGGDDTWFFHHEGLYEKNLLLEHSAQFLSDFNPVLPFQRNATFIAGVRNLLGDWEYNLLVKPQALFNILSGDNYYVNIVFFSFITFWGHYWFFELLVRVFPSQRSWWLALVFLFPPVIFWLSGFRGDGILFFFIALTLNRGYTWMKTGNQRALLWAFLGMTGTLIMRDPVAMLLCPALLSVYITVKYRLRAWKVWVPVFAISSILFFATALISPEQNLPRMIADRQAAFFALHGNTVFKLDPLEPNAGSFLRILPQAVVNVFFRPTLWEAKGALQLVASADICFFWALVLLACFRDRRSWRDRFTHPLLLFLLIFSAALYVFIGYTVPFPGAIVRYKIIPELFLYVWILYTYNKKLHI